MCKRIFIFYVVVSLVAVPLLGQLTCNVVYAEQQPAPGDDWTNVPVQDQYLAFLAYMRARDLTLSGSFAGALSTFTSDMYQNLVKKVGLDMNTIQSGLYGIYQNNQWLRFGFSYLGINAFNRLCAQFLQDYSLSVGDENVDKTVYSGEYFTDFDGNTCLVFVLDDSVSIGNGSNYWQSDDSYILYYGTPLVLTNDYIFTSVNNGTYVNTTINFTETVSRTYNFKKNSNFIYNNGNGGGWNTTDGKQSLWTIDCYPIVFKYKGDLYGGIFTHIISGTGTNLANISGLNPPAYFVKGIRLTDSDSDPTGPIKVTSPKVKDALPEPPDDDITIIEPDGTIQEPEPEFPEPGGTVPDWTLPDTQITPIDPENPSGGSNIDWNFQLPDLNIDWNINLVNKFPFCIPGDIYDVTTTLSTDPVAPQFSGTIDLLIYQWQFDIDLSMFDSIAVICRNAFFILFVVGLIALSRAIIMKG